MAKFILSAFADEAGTTLNEQIAALKRNGIDYIEPRNINGKPILTLTDEELKEVKSELDKNGIRVNSLGSPIGKYPITEPFDKHLIDFYRALEVCKALGTDKMRMFSFFTKQSELSKHRNEVLYRLTEMCKIAKEHGITLCHENESEIYGQNPEEMLDLMTNVDGLKGIFDPANYRMNGCDVIAGIKATIPKLAYLHIKDAIFNSQLIVPAGDGEGKIPEVLDMVNEATDEVVYLTLEPHLFLFDAYKGIDKHELKVKYTFTNNTESFDFAANALKNLLAENGYKKDGNNVWKK
jgi:sugar phosphate isomerase/epimerase